MTAATLLRPGPSRGRRRLEPPFPNSASVRPPGADPALPWRALRDQARARQL